MGHSFEMRSWRYSTILVLACCVAVGCGPSRSVKQSAMKEGDPKVAAEAQTIKRYPLTGRVVSIDKPTQSINVDGNEIPGFMAAMTMPYQVRDASLLDKLAPEDHIKAEIVVGDKSAYLENVTVVAKTATQAPNK